MKAEKIYQLIALTSMFFFFLSSCRKGGRCELPLNVNQSEVVVAFQEKATGNYLYAEINPLYNKDSLKVFDQNGNDLVILNLLRAAPDNSNISIYWLSFGPLYDFQTDSDSFNSEICKTYTIKYSYNESDTVKVCFKSKKTKCGSVFETLKVYHKDKLIGNASEDTHVLVTIQKD